MARHNHCRISIKVGGIVTKIQSANGECPKLQWESAPVALLNHCMISLKVEGIVTEIQSAYGEYPKL